MARMHGKNVRVYLGSRDVSADLSTITPEFNVDMHERTTFNDAGWHTVDPGLKGWSCQAAAFYQPQAGGIGQQMESLGTDFPISVYDGDGDTIGETGVILGGGKLTKRGQPISVADLIKLALTFAGDGAAGMFARMLHVLGAEVGAGNSASVDNGASSANGGIGALHVTAATGSGTVKVQHSTDNITFADLITFTATAAATSEAISVTGTVNRYLRDNHTPGTSITYVAGFARY
jgi:hypothetical protein